LARDGDVRSTAAGEVLFRHGNEAYEVIVVLEGGASFVVRSGEDTRQLVSSEVGQPPLLARAEAVAYDIADPTALLADQPLVEHSEYLDVARDWGGPNPTLDRRDANDERRTAR
jgi:hypothetical protein